ncbi:TonB-dependent receptor [Phenylobacterium sp. VNQ135]|uniref:TonB-dependent receptor n=1 Tax=Phenylobacterium sp. VNQ135 TaxID=3400922 RepID=UPI003C078BBD
MRASSANRALKLALVVGAAATALATGAQAQESAADIEELVVTATRRETTVQTTPIAITALGENTIENLGATGLQDVTTLVPSLKIGGGSDGGGRITLRGIQASGEATVGLYYDETPLTGPSDTSQNSGGSSQDGNLFDVERIEVLRGPQGTLYGSGSMGGTVRVIFNKADVRDYEGSVDVMASTMREGDAAYYAKGVVNVPIIEDKLGARVVAYQEVRGGFIDNVRYGHENINDRKIRGARLMLSAFPTENISWHGMFMAQKTTADGGGSTWYPLLGDEEYSTDRYVVPINRDELTLYSSDLDYDLGFATVTWAAAYYEWDQLNASDYTNTMRSNRSSNTNCRNWFTMSLGIPTTTCNAAQLAQFGAFADSLMPTTLYKPAWVHTTNSELRISSNGDNRLNWTFGGFIEMRKDYVDSTLAVVDKNTGIIAVPPTIFFHRDITTETDQTAFFGDVSYEIIDGLTANVGLRRFKYKKKTYGETDMPNWVSGSLVEPFREFNADASGWLKKFSLNYQMNSDVLIYATAAQGFRPGGANNTPNLETALIPYGPDKVWNYELGVKTSWFDRRLTVNAALFQIDWDDIQTSAQTLSGCCSFIVNAGKAQIRGVELEFTARPITGLLISGGVTVADPELKEDQINANIRDSTSLGDKGDQIPNVSKFMASTSVEYTWPISDSFGGMVRADYSYVGKSYSHFRPTNVYYEQQGDYAVVNLRAGVEGEDWGAYLFVRNAFDIFGEISVTSSSGSEQLTSSVLPRTIGVNLRKSF